MNNNNTRFIPTWEELKHAKRVRELKKFTGNPIEDVAASLLKKIFFYAAQNGERVAFPNEWQRLDRISKEQYENWYYNYYRKTQLFENECNRRSFSEKRSLNPKVWSILGGEEED